MRSLKRLAPIFAGAMLIVGAATAGQVGDIGAFYFSTPPPGCITPLCNANAGLITVDDVVFVVQNTSGIDITNAVLSILAGGGVVADSYTIGTVPNGGQVLIEPGVSNDGLGHPINGLFKFTGSATDESELGTYPGNTTFTFSGLQGATSIISQDLCAVTLPNFTPACTAGLSNDGTIVGINFLGDRVTTTALAAIALDRRSLPI